MNKFFRSTLLTSMLAAGLAACGDDVTVVDPPPPPPPPAPAVHSITVGPDGGSVTVGGTLSMVAAVNADAGVATTVTWSSSDNSKASVSAAGVVTGVAAGSVGIKACSTVNTSVCGVATVAVVAAPVATVTAVVITPPSATLVVGQSITASASVQGTNSPSQAVTWSSLAPAIATVDANGVVTAVANGTAVIKATSNANSSIAGTMSVTVSTPAPATISIQSITQGTLNTPVTLTNVNGQIEITLNVDNGAYTITKAQALVNGATVIAEQIFASSSASAAPAAVPSTVVLSLNTRQVQKLQNGTYVPVIFNGPNSITARIFVAGNPNPISSNAVPAVFQNRDAWMIGTGTLSPAATTPSAPGNVVSSGATWYKSDVNFAGGYSYVSFFPVTPAITVGSICGNSANAVSGTPQTGITLAGSFPCASTNNVEGGVTMGFWNVTPGTAPAADVIYIAADSENSEVVGTKYVVASTDRYNLLDDGSSSTSNTVWIDTKAPVVSLNTVAFNTSFDQPWVNAAYNFNTSAVVTTDGGSGVASEQTYAAANGTPATSVTTCDNANTAVATGADLAESLTSDGTPEGYQICGTGTDVIGNVSAKFGGSNWFGVDKVAPTARFVTNTAPAPVGTISGVSTTANTTIYSIATPHVTTDIFGIEANDGRSGFHQGAAITNFPVNITQSGLNAAGAITCTNTYGLPTGLSDLFVRSTEHDANCGQAAGVVAYFNWSAFVTDRAGNVSSTFSRNFAKDDQAPADLTSFAAGQLTYAPGSPAIFNVWGSDDLEVIDGSLLMVYDANNDGTREFAIRYPYSLFQIGAAWDNVFTNVVSGLSLTIPSLIGRVDSVRATDSLATLTYALPRIALPDSVYGNIRDVAGQADATPIAIGLDSLTQFTSATTAAWQTTGGIFDAAANRQFFGSIAGGNHVATHKTSTSVTAPYFDAVNLYGRIAGEVVFCGSMGTPVLTDNGIYRTWTYSVPTPSGSNACTGATNWYVGGVKGNALLLSVLF